MILNQISLKTRTEIAAFGMICLGVFTLVVTCIGQIASLLGGAVWRWDVVLYPGFGVLMFYFFSRLLKHSFAGWCFAVVFMILVFVSFFMNYAEIDTKNPINWLYCFWPLAEAVILFLILSDRTKHFAVLKETVANQTGNGRFSHEIQITKKARFAQAVAVIMFLLFGYGFIGIVGGFGYSLMFGLAYAMVQLAVYSFVWLGYGLAIFYLGKAKIIGWYFGLASFGATIFMGFNMLPGVGLGAIVLLPVLLVAIIAFALLFFDILNNYFYRRGKSKI